MASYLEDRGRLSKRSVSHHEAQTDGTAGSNSPPSATESGLCGFSAQSGEIARAYGFICVMGGTGENHIPAVRAQTRPKSLLASEAVPSMRDDDAIDSRTDLAEM
jgi:hypothetical protein